MAATRRPFPLVDSLVGVSSEGAVLGGPALLTHGLRLHLFEDQAATIPLDAVDVDDNPIEYVTVDGVTIPTFYGPLDDTVLTVWAKPLTAGGSYAGEPFPIQAQMRAIDQTILLDEDGFVRGELIRFRDVESTVTTNLIRDPGFERGDGGAVKGANATLAYYTGPSPAPDGIRDLLVRTVASPGAGGPTPNWRYAGGYQTIDEDLDYGKQYTSAIKFNNPAGNASGVKLRVQGAGVVGSPVESALDNVRDTDRVLAVTFTTVTESETADIGDVRAFLYSSTGGLDEVRVLRHGLAEGAVAVLGSGDDPGWAWSGDPYLSASVNDEIEYVLPERLEPDELAEVFAAREAPPVPRSGLSTPTGVPHTVGDVTETVLGSSDPIPLREIDGVLWGGRGQVGSSWDGSAWVTRFTLTSAGSGSGIQDIRKAGDGELIVDRGTHGLWKSDDFAVTPNAFTKKITTTVVADDGIHGEVSGEIVPWGWETWENYCVAAEYQGDGFYRPASDKVELSIDTAETFHVVYRLTEQDNIGDPAQSHLHVAMFDPYHLTEDGDPRVYISHHGNKTYQRIKYSDDACAMVRAGTPELSSWVTVLRGTEEETEPDAQPTVGCCLPHAPVWGSDGLPDGVARFPRLDGGIGSLQRLWTLETDEPGLSLISKVAQPVLDDAGNRIGALISFRSRRNSYPAIVAYTDGAQAFEVYRYTPSGATQPFVLWAGIVGDTFHATVLDEGVYKWIRGTAPGVRPIATAAAAAEPEQSVWFVRRTSDLARASTTTVAADPELAIAALPVGTYLLTTWLPYDGDTAADFKLGFGFTGTATLAWQVNGQGTSGTSDLSTVQHNTVTAGLAGTAAYGNPTTGSVAKPNGVLIVTAPGTFELQWAQNVSSATPTNLRAPAWLRLEKVA